MLLVFSQKIKKKVVEMYYLNVIIDYFCNNNTTKNQIKAVYATLHNRKWLSNKLQYHINKPSLLTKTKSS